jgi:hypothetical protein
LAEVQVSMEVPPPPTADGAALIDTVGGDEVTGELAPPQAASNSDRETGMRPPQRRPAIKT